MLAHLLHGLFGGIYCGCLQLGDSLGLLQVLRRRLLAALKVVLAGAQGALRGRGLRPLGTGWHVMVFSRLIKQSGLAVAAAELARGYHGACHRPWLGGRVPL